MHIFSPCSGNRLYATNGFFFSTSCQYLNVGVTNARYASVRQRWRTHVYFVFVNYFCFLRSRDGNSAAHGERHARAYNRRTRITRTTHNDNDYYRLTYVRRRRYYDDAAALAVDRQGEMHVVAHSGLFVVSARIYANAIRRVCERRVISITIRFVFEKKNVLRDDTTVLRCCWERARTDAGRKTTAATTAFERRNIFYRYGRTISYGVTLKKETKQKKKKSRKYVLKI